MGGILFIVLCVFFHVSAHEHKNYIDFQVQGYANMDSYQINKDANVSSLWSPSNIEIDFNFNDHLSVVSSTAFANFEDAPNSVHALNGVLNNSNKISTPFGNTFLPRVLALSIHGKHTDFLIGKIVPNTAPGASMHFYKFNMDWTGVSGTFLNSAYKNTNKIGMQIFSDLKLTTNSEQAIEIAIFQSDKFANEGVLGEVKSFGYLYPANLRNKIEENNIASNTSIPSSLSLLLVNKVNHVYTNSSLVMSVYLRSQGINKDVNNLSGETTYIFSTQYEEMIDKLKLGAFGEIGSVANAYGIEGLRQSFVTASLYARFERFVVSVILNNYKASEVVDLNIGKSYISQSQLALGYDFSNAFKLRFGVKKIADKVSNIRANGVGIVLYYDFGTKDYNNRIIDSFI